MPRDTFFKDEVLKEMAGRLVFGASSIEEKIDKYPKPELATYVPPKHPMDELAAEFGLHGFEFKALELAAREEMPKNELLKEAYRKYLMIAKLILLEPLEKVRAYEQRQFLEKAQRDKKYQQSLNNYESRKKSLTNSWTRVRETIRTRWRRMLKSLEALIDMDPRLETMAQRDVDFIMELHRRRKVMIEGGRVAWVNYDSLGDFSIEDINEIIDCLDSLPSGGFKVKPEVRHISED